MHTNRLILLLLLLTYTVSASTFYQVQIRNRSLSMLNYKSYSTTGRWESSPAKRIFPLTFSNAISTGSWSSATYQQGAYVTWGERGCTCKGCDCSVKQKSPNSWVVDFKC
ncbi:hypothetical protein P9112_005200 [Eukaryota sp. TZLM1-RC]